MANIDDKTNSYKDFQDAQSQLLNIQAQQQANLQEARLAGQTQAANNETLNQAAQVAAQTVAMGNATQPVTFNPTTSAVLQQYGLSQPRIVKTQTRNQSVTPQHVTINNNTSNVTNNNVSVPANIGGPLQGRPVQINPDVQMGTFKTWLSNVFARQNAESARRDREYERRSTALTRDSNKILKKIGEIGGNIGRALDPRRMTSNSINTLKTLFAVLGFAKFAKNIKYIAHRVDKFFDWLGIKGGRNGEVSENDTIWDKLRKGIVKLLGGKAEGEGAEGVGLALRRLFYTKDGEDSVNGRGIFNYVLDRIKLELDRRIKSAGISLDKYKESISSNKGLLERLGINLSSFLDNIVGALSATVKGFLSADASHVVNSKNDTSVNERNQFDFMDVESFQYKKETMNSLSKYGESYVEKRDESGNVVRDAEGNPILEKQENAGGFVFDEHQMATDRNGKRIGGMLRATWETHDINNPNVSIQHTKLINPSQLEINNMDKIISNTSEENLSSGGKVDNLNHAFNLDKDGNLVNETAFFNASLDVIQVLINQKNGTGYDYNKVVSYLQKMDRYLAKTKGKYAPVCKQWPKFFPKKAGESYNHDYYKIVPADWNVDLRNSVGAPHYDDLGRGLNMAGLEKYGRVANDVQWGAWAKQAGIPRSQANEFKNSYTDILYITKAASKTDNGIDGVVYDCIIITRDELLDVIKRYMNLSEGTNLKDLQSYKFQIQMRKSMYNNTSDNIKNDENFSQQYNQKMDEFAELEASNREYEEGLRRLDEEEFRYETAGDYIKNETVVGQVLSEAFKRSKEIYQEGVDRVTGFTKTAEFINKLRPALLDKLREYDLPEENIERYADILLSQLALESAWGKKPSGENNYGGIKAPTEIKDGVRVPIDPEHAKERITREVLDGGLDKYPHLRSKIVEEPWHEVDGWHYKIRDWFKSYDSLEDFVDDYVNMLNNNWSSAMSGDTKLNDEELVSHYASNLKKGKNGGAYYTADAEKYTDTLTKIYNTIKSARERVERERNEAQQGGNEEGGGEEGGGTQHYVPRKPKTEKTIEDYENFDQYFNEVLSKKYPNREIYQSPTKSDWIFEPEYALIHKYTKEKEKLPEGTFDIKKALTALRSNTGTVLNISERKSKQMGLKIGDPKDRYVIKSISQGGTHSVGQCGYYVRTAINAGGIPGRFGNAYQFKDNLPTKGFKEIPDNAALKPGDISVEEATNMEINGRKYNENGHVAMWDGYNWISDFVQNGQHVHNSRPEVRGKLHKFRYTGPKINTSYIPPSSIKGLSSSDPIPEASSISPDNTNVVYSDSDITAAQNNNQNNITENQNNNQQNNSISSVVTDYLSDGVMTALSNYVDVLSERRDENVLTPSPQTRPKVDLITGLNSISAPTITSNMSESDNLLCGGSNYGYVPNLNPIPAPVITPEQTFEPIPNMVQNITSTNTSNDELGGDSDNSSSDMKQLITLLNKMLTIEVNTSYNTAAVPDKIDVLAQLIARQQNKPVETRTPINSMLREKPGKNW